MLINVYFLKIMPRVPIASEDERKFIVDGIQSNFRNDGRNCRSYRPLLLATDVINTANGSCLLKLVRYISIKILQNEK